MFTCNLKRLYAIFAFGLLVALGAQTTHAAGVSAGTPVTNNVSVAYDVGGNPQAAATDDVTFNVDTAINFNVSSGGTTPVIPNAQRQVLAFTLTNNGNATQGYGLAVEANAGNVFNMNNVDIYIDDGDATFNAGTDTLYDDTNSLNNSGDLAEDASVIIFVVADVPPFGGGTAPTNGQTSQYNLLAISLDSGTAVNALGSQTVNQAGDAWIATTSQNIYREGTAGAHSLDANDDGQDSNSGTYSVVTSAVSVTKSVAVTDDQIGGAPGANEKAIPGAILTYTIVITNPSPASSATATDIVITDTLPENEVAYVANSVDVTVSTLGTDPNLTDNGAAGGTTNVRVVTADNNLPAGIDTITVENIIDANGIEIPVDESVTITFDVQIIP